MSLLTPMDLLLTKSSHLLAMIMDADRDNPLFRAPVGEKAKHILDLGTGSGNWAM